MQPYFTDDTITLYAGDCLDVLPTLPDASIDAVVCDPPYELGFMGRAWDASGIAYNVEVWRQCLRVLKPGGHLLAFGGTRTYHRMTVAIEDAGFEIRDSLHWITGSGFPKSLDVSKAIDKAAGAMREVVATIPDRWTGKGTSFNFSTDRPQNTVTVTGPPATDDARRWSGFGTALKPSHEPIVCARKPLSGTVAATVLEHGTGALNIDGCRVTHGADVDLTAVQRQQHRHDGDKNWRLRPGHEQAMYAPGGRWPTNVVLTHSAACADECAPDCPVAEMDRQSQGKRASKPSKTGSAGKNGGTVYGGGNGIPKNGYVPLSRDDEGGASRFFPTFRYEAKAPSSERPRGEDGTAHVTVKPLALMRWLVRLVTPPGGVVLDPFLGSGTTAEAAVIEGFRCIGIERDEAHLPLIKARLSKPIQPALGFEDAS